MFQQHSEGQLLLGQTLKRSLAGKVVWRLKIMVSLQRKPNRQIEIGHRCVCRGEEVPGAPAKLCRLKSSNCLPEP